MRVGFTAHYRCVNCKHEWREKRTPLECQACGHLYVEWVNFNEIKEQGFKDRAHRRRRGG